MRPVSRECRQISNPARCASSSSSILSKAWPLSVATSKKSTVRPPLGQTHQLCACKLQFRARCNASIWWSIIIRTIATDEPILVAPPRESLRVFINNGIPSATLEECSRLQDLARCCCNRGFFKE